MGVVMMVKYPIKIFMPLSMMKLTMHFAPLNEVHFGNGSRELLSLSFSSLNYAVRNIVIVNSEQLCTYLTSLFKIRKISSFLRQYDVASIGEWQQLRPDSCCLPMVPVTSCHLRKLPISLILNKL